MIQCLWDKHVESIIDVKLYDTDADKNEYEPITELLDWCQNIKRDKHGKHCNYQQKLFSYFVFSVNVMIGMEYMVVLT